MARLPGESIDLVVTSPPYNLGTCYGAYDDERKPSEFLEWCLEWGQQVQRLLKPEGSFFLNVGAVPSNPLLPHELAISFSRLFVLQNTFHWVKSITIETKQNQELSVGHFKPMNSSRFVTDCHEFVFHFTKTGRVALDRLVVGVAYADKSNVRRWAHTKGADRRCRGNNWFVPYETIRDRLRDRPHPATFPKQLVTQCIKIHGQRANLTMLDPFLGIGTSARAAQDCGVGVFYGFEIDPVYLDFAKHCLGL
jgi:site-specific DNA-methyltransferase (adenine-specific)